MALTEKNRIPTLIVDDDVDILNYFRAILKNTPNELYFATNGLEAVEKAKEHKLDLVFLDVMMPIMNGIEALAEIKKIRMETQVVMISAYSDSNVVRDALNKGAFTYLFKPLNKVDIMSVTMKCLHQMGVEPQILVK